MKDHLKCLGVGRDGENAKAILISFDRPLTDDQIRFLHECMCRWVHLAPEPKRPVLNIVSGAKP